MNGKKTLSSAIFLALALAVIAGAGAQVPDGPVSRPPVPAGEARIPFADHGGIYNWQVLNNRTILIQGQDRSWYKATLFSPCVDLPFAERVGFQSNPDGTFDKFSSIRVGRQNCRLTSLVPTTPPAKKPKSHDTTGPSTPGTAPAAGASGTPATNPQ